MSKLTKKQLEELLQPSKNSVLSASEKAKMRMNLSSFIEENPVRVSRFEFLTSRLFRLRPILASLTVVFLFSGVSLASAQTALLGDALYDLKLFVNEEVPMIFMDETEKQFFVVKQVENRLEEAQLLKEKGELSGEQEEVLQTKFDQYFEQISVNEHPGKIRKDLSTVLEQHQEILPQFTVVTEDEEDSEEDSQEPDQKPWKGKPFKNKNSMTLKEFFELTHKPMEELENDETLTGEDETVEEDESDLLVDPLKPTVEEDEGEDVEVEETDDDENDL